MPRLKTKSVDADRARDEARALGCNCAECPQNYKVPVLPEPKKSAILSVIGERPGPQEERKREFFVGWSGGMLDKGLYRAGLQRDDVYVDNALLCGEGRYLSPKEWSKAVECCRPHLERQLGSNRTILAFGARAMHSLTGKKKIMPWIGGPLRDEAMSGRRRVLPAFHPAYMGRGSKMAYMPVFYILVQRAAALARGTLPAWRWPHVIIRPGRAALAGLRLILREGTAGHGVGADLETDGDDFLSSPITALGLASPSVAVSLPWHRYFTTKKHGWQRALTDYPRSSEHSALVARILRECPIEFQNGQGDILGFERVGLKVFDFAADRMLEHAVAGPLLDHSLGFQMAVESHASRWKSEFGAETDKKGTAKYVRRDPYVLRRYNGLDAWTTAWLGTPLMERVHSVHRGPELLQQYMDLNREAAIPMRRQGVVVDAKLMETYHKRLSLQERKAKNDLTRMASRLGFRDFNPASHPQRCRMFQDILQVQPSKYNDSGDPSWDAEVLTQIIAGTNLVAADFARGMKTWRKWEALRKYTAYPLDDNSCLHPVWRVDGARTGRWSSQEPNMQNIPKLDLMKDEEGEEPLFLRTMFSARPGCRVVSADYKQLELRIVALNAGDEPLLEAFAKFDAGLGPSPHVLNTMDMFGQAFDKGTLEYDITKNGCYEMNYGGTDRKLYEHMVVNFPDITFRMCQEMHRRWFEKHPAIAVYHEKLLAQAKSQGYLEFPLSGRRMHFFGGVKPTECYNYPIQGTAADLINTAALGVARELDWTEEMIHSQVHDELNLEGPDVGRLVEILKRHMEREVVLGGHSVRFPIDISVGENWHDTQEWRAA